jgi:hypothetical protein
VTTLREARDQGKLEQFIKEHEAETGDRDAMDKTISSMAGRSSEARPASKKGDRGG